MVLINDSLSSGIIVLDFNVYLFDISSARYCPDRSSLSVVMLSLNVITPQAISLDDNFLCFSVVSLFIINPLYYAVIVIISFIFSYSS